MNGTVAAIYVRVSTTKASQKDSPEHQRGLCEEKARALGLDVCRVYEDRDSGTSIVGRDAIRRLVRDAAAGEFGTIVFASLSRFSRDTLDSLNLKRALVDALGLRLISIEEGFDSARDGDELKFQIISAVNQKLSEQISLSSKRGIRQSALKGNFTGSAAPYGYRKITRGGRKTLEPDEAESEVVHLIYELYTLRDYGEKAIVRHLNERGIPAPRGGVWGVSSVQRVLTNEAYTGENVFGKYEWKQIYPDPDNLTDRRKKQVRRERSAWERSGFKTHEAIVDEDTFSLAQEIRKRRGGGKRGGVRSWRSVFAGLLVCGECGAAVVCESSHRRRSVRPDDVYRYLVCSARRRQGEHGCANALRLPYGAFYEFVIQSVRERIIRFIDLPAFLAGLQARIVPKAPVRGREEPGRLVVRIESVRQLLFGLRKQRMLGEVDEEQYAYEKRRYERELGDLLRQRETGAQPDEDEAAAERARVGAAEAAAAAVRLTAERPDEIRAALVLLIERITVYRCGDVVIASPLAAETDGIPHGERHAEAEREGSFTSGRGVD